MLLILVVAIVALGACGSDDGVGNGGDPITVPAGDTAVWDVDADDPPTSASASFTALVTRLGCSGGETGEVREPVVSIDADGIVVTFTVAPLSGGDCPGNDPVPQVVELDEPIGDRELVDGACLSAEAESTSFCSGGSVRWSQ